MSEMQLNQRVADEIIGKRQLNGRQFQSGEWVALLDGQVLAVADDLDAALEALRTQDPNPDHGMLFEVTAPVTDVIR